LPEDGCDGVSVLAELLHHNFRQVVLHLDVIDAHKTAGNRVGSDIAIDASHRRNFSADFFQRARGVDGTWWPSMWEKA